MNAPLPTILFLAPYFDPAVAAGIRCTVFADALARLPARLLIVTRGPQPSLEPLPGDGLLCRLDPAGRLPADLDTPGLPRWPIRLPMPGPGPDPRFTRGSFRAAHALARRYQPDLILASAPPFALLTAARLLANTYDTRLALDLRDAWFTAMPWPYPHALSRHAARREEARCLARADLVITATETLRNHLLKATLSITSDKTITIRHGFAPQPDHPGPLPPPLEQWSDKFLLVHTGQLRGLDPDPNILTRARRAAQRHLLGARFLDDLMLHWMSPRYLLQAARTVADADPQFAADVRFAFLGPRYPQLDEMARKYAFEASLVQLGKLAPETTQRISARADALLLFLYGIRNDDHHWCVPSKLYAYLAAGKPIIALAPPGEALDIATGANLALPAPPTDMESIAARLREAFAIHTGARPTLLPNTDYITSFRRDLQGDLFLRAISAVLP